MPTSIAADADRPEHDPSLVDRDDDRPAGRVEERPVAGQDPGDRHGRRARIAEPLERDLRTDRQPVGRRQALRDERRRRAGALSAAAPSMSWSDRIGAGIDGQDRDRRPERRPGAGRGRGTSAARCAGAATATPGVPRIVPTVASASPPSANAEMRRSARPTRSRTVRSTDAVDAVVRGQARRTARPRRGRCRPG